MIIVIIESTVNLPQHRACALSYWHIVLFKFLKNKLCNFMAIFYSTLTAGAEGMHSQSLDFLLILCDIANLL